MRKGVIILCIGALLAGFTSCRYREIDSDQKLVGIYFRLDWSDYVGDDLPTGVSIYCYPQNSTTKSKMPYIYKSNYIDLVKADMPPGVYDIIAFNQVEEEFETLEFTGMYRYATAKVTIREREKPQWRLVADQPVLEEPEWFALENIHDCQVTEEMYYGNSVTYIDLKPKNMIYTTAAVFRVIRSNKIYKTYGEMSGLASGLMLGSQKKIGPASMQLFESVTVYPHEETPETGEVTATFHTFGIPEKDTVPTAANPEDNLLHYRFFLVDEETFSNFSFKVGDRLTVNDSLMFISVELGHGSDIPQNPNLWEFLDPDRPGILPDVEPKHQKSGLDAKIINWDKEIIIDLK